jgi:large subunit ribosomal protein L15
MILNDVHQGIQKRKSRKRVGRGPGSGHGKTSGRGHKGFYSRSGSSRRAGFEGGQMPLARRIAKRGFNNRQFADEVVIVNLSALEHHFENGETVNRETLAEKRVIKGRYDVLKVLGKGQLTKQLTVEANRFSASAKEAIIAAGGIASEVAKETQTSDE